MSDSMGSVSVWIDHLKNGRDDAAAEIWQRYFTRLVGLARGRLAGVAYREDMAEDVAASVFQSFFHRAAGGGFRQLEDRDDLWQLLAVLATRKAVNARRREGAAKRGAGQVIPASNLGGGAEEASADVLGNLAGVEPSPEEAVAAAEEVCRLLEMLGDDELRQIARARLEGFSNEEIAERRGVSLATVERKLARVRARWAAEVGA